MLTVEESLINQTLFFFDLQGPKSCITTGRPDSSATKTEVVDVVNGESCADLADFPLAKLMVKLWVPTSMEHLLCVVATLLHITKHVTNTPILDGNNLQA